MSIDTLLNSKMHIPMYASLLNPNVTLFLCIATKSFPLFCVTYSLVWMSILNSLSLLLTSFTSILFLKCSIKRCSLICTTLFHLCHHFSCFYSFLSWTHRPVEMKKFCNFRGRGATNNKMLSATLVGWRRTIFISNCLRRVEKLNICIRQVL